MLNLERSRITGLAIIGLHLLAALAIISADLALWIKLTSLPLIAASLYYNLRAERAIASLVWHKGDRWHIRHRAQPIRRARLSRIDFFSRWLVIVTLDCPARPRWRRLEKFVIAADSLDADTFRLLRVRLRIEAIPMLQSPPEPPFHQR